MLKDLTPLLFDSAPDAMVICDRKGQIVLVNAQAKNLFGYERQELAGQPIEILMPERFRKQHREYVTLYFDHPRTRPMGGVTDLWCLRGDGSEFAAEISLSPLKTSDRIFALAAIRDITRRKQIVQKLKDSEEKFRTLFEESKDTIFISTPEGKLLDINQAGLELFGYASKDEILRINIAQELYVNSADRDTINQKLQKNGFLKDHELKLKKKNGEKLTVLESITVDRDEHGKIRVIEV